MCVSVSGNTHLTIFIAVKARDKTVNNIGAQQVEEKYDIPTCPLRPLADVRLLTSRLFPVWNKPIITLLFIVISYCYQLSTITVIRILDSYSRYCNLKVLLVSVYIILLLFCLSSKIFTVPCTSLKVFFDQFTKKNKIK